MQSGHGKMDDRGKKFIDSAFTIRSATTVSVATCKKEPSRYPPHHHYLHSQSSTKSVLSLSSSSTCSEGAAGQANLTPSQVSFTSSLLQGFAMSKAYSTVQPDHIQPESDDASLGFSIYDDGDDNEPLSPFPSNNNSFFLPATSTTTTTHSSSDPINNSNKVNGISCGDGGENNEMEAGLLYHHHHHRSRIKPYYPGANNSSSSNSSSHSRRKKKMVSPLEKEIESSSKSRRWGRRRRSSSTNSSSFTHPPTCSLSSHLSTTTKNGTRTNTTSSSSSTSSPSSPSRFLLTFLSSCHLVQVTSRLVVALAMTSLFLVLVHVMPGAYCSSSTLLYSQVAAAAAASSASSSTTSITTGAQHHHATKRAYFNQSVLSQLNIYNKVAFTAVKATLVYKTFQPLPSSSSSSSFTAGANSELTSGGGVLLGGGGVHQRTWLKTRWPLTVRSSTSTAVDKAISSGITANTANANNVVAADLQMENVEINGADDALVNNKLYSNQLAVNTLLSNDRNHNNNNDYVDNQPEEESNVVVLRNSNNVHNKNGHDNVEPSSGGNLNAKNDLGSDNSKSSAKLGKKSITIDSNNYDYYNNGNNNNNRSNYNYYDTSFVNVDSTSSSSSQATSLLLRNKSEDKDKIIKNTDNTDSEKTVDNNTQQQQQPQQLQPMNRGSSNNNVNYDNNGEEISSRQQRASEDFSEGAMDNEQQERGRASTAKDERGRGLNNGTTKAERDGAGNVTSTGVRPTMAFTNSYFGRVSSKQAFGEGREMSHTRSRKEQEEDIYGIGEEEDKYAEAIQADEPCHHHHFSREDNKQSSKQGRRARPPISVKTGRVGDDGSNEENDENNFSSSSRRRKKSWRGETSDKDEFLHLVSYSTSSRRQQQQQGKSLSDSSTSSGPTAITATTTITAAAAAAQATGKLFAFQQNSVNAKVLGGGGSSNAVPSSGSFLLDATTSLFPSSPSSPSSSSASKLKSIKFSSPSSFPSSSSSSSSHVNDHYIPSSSTATLHYPNEKSRARDDILLLDDGESSSIRKTLYPSSSSATLSNRNVALHHNHHYRQQQEQRQSELEREHHYNQVFRFGEASPPDEYEDEIIVDDNNDVLEENEDITGAVSGQEQISSEKRKGPTKSTTTLTNEAGELTSYSGKQRLANKLTNSNQQEKQEGHHYHQVVPTIFGELGASSSSSSSRVEVVVGQEEEEGVELITNRKSNDDNHPLTPTAAATASKSLGDGESSGGVVVGRKYPYRVANDISNANSNNNALLLKPTEVVAQSEEDEETLMLGDDPSIIIGRDNLFGSSGGGGNRMSSLPISSNPLNKNSNGSGSSASTTASTFGSAKQRNPLQIRRDLSRLIASAPGRGLNGMGNGASSLVGDDEEPIPNKCDRLFMWNGTHGVQNGTFESPTMVSEEGHLYQCIFMFLADPVQRVEVVFTQFNVRGTPPECVHEWVDIWTEVEGMDPTDLVTTPFSGRYCGKIPPRRRISLYGGIAIGFYSDKNFTHDAIFRGTFAFINNNPYQIGTPVPRTLCSYTIKGAMKRNGDLISPTYPGVYPKNLSCSYKFIGIEGQRIRLEFRDFDVFYGGAHCPFDEVKVYDGMDPTAPLIGTYCGQQRNLVVFSSAHLMLVTFTTLERSTEAQNRGFKGVWEFSESFVKLDFIEKNHGTHIRGTECDQRILSKGQSSGVVYSPNYPFPYVPKIVCRYFIYGLQDPQHLERVRLSFEKFDVITNINSQEDTENQSETKKCGDGFLKVYLKGQEVIQAYDKADYEFCGKESPHDVVSDGPRLVLVFSSGETVGSGFKGKYQFETEYRVPGTAAPDGSCHFTYYSTSRMKGEFNSPRFPSNYPSTTNCTYIFFQQPNEQVRIVFDNFKMRSDRFNQSDRGAYGDYCEEDWVEIWNVISDADDRLVGRYCGSTAPGPIESREKASALKVILHTDDEGVSSGFKARYIYFNAKTIFGECGQNITQAQYGELTSPKWPQKYDGPSKGEGSATCNWYLSVRPGSRVMLNFQSFAIEGDPNTRGCPAAAVRIWIDPDGVPSELCGETLTLENTQFVSTRNLMRVTFITADKAVGAPGFRAVWTEVQERPSPSTPCHNSYFRCDKSMFCIPAELRCNGINNCGIGETESDMSDEEQCGLEFGDMNTVIAIIVGVVVSLFLIVLVCAYGQRRKRRRRRRLQLRRPPIHVCDNAGARFAAMDSV